MNQEIKISKREQQVLELISQEYTSDEIAKEMFISTHTAHTHRKNLLHKLEVRNTAGLVRKAFECRLLQISCMLIILLLNTYIQAQDPLVDIEGDSRIRGLLDINHQDDTTSVYVGRLAGANIIHPSTVRNTFIGSRAGRLSLDPISSTVIGYEAGYNSNGYDNVFVGVQAGYHNLADYNTFLGYNSGYDNTDGSCNTFVGFESGQNNVNGDLNSFFGSVAGRNNIDGNNNSFFGEASGLRNTNGRSNSYFGQLSGSGNIDGDSNSYFGASAGNDNKKGSYNTALGASAGEHSAFGSYNTFIGYRAGIDQSITSDSLDKSMAFGYNSKVACHNCAVIGGSASDAVNLGIGTTAPISRLHVKADAFFVKESLLMLEGVNSTEMIIKDLGGTANLKFVTIDQDNDAWEIKVKATADNTPSDRAKMIFTYGQDSIFQLKGDGNAKLAGMLTENSDSRLKKNVAPIANVLNRLMLLSGYTYNWIDPSKSEELQIGFLAQEVQAQFPELVQESKNGMLSVSYTRFVPLLIQGLREQEERIQNLEMIVQQLVDLQNDK